MGGSSIIGPKITAQGNWKQPACSYSRSCQKTLSTQL
jgi:hypothetical protein